MQSDGIGVTRISLNFAMFRVGVRAGRPARRRPGRPVVARTAGVLLTLVAARDAVPVEHEVPAAVGAAVRAATRTRRLVPRVGVASVIAEGFLVLPVSRRSEQPHTGHHSAVPGESGRDRTAASPTAARPTSGELRAELPENGDALRLPEQVRVRMAKLKSAAGQRRRRLPGRPGAQPHGRRGGRSRRRHTR